MEMSVSARSRPVQLFWVVWGLLYFGSLEEVGEILEACCDQFMIPFADKIESIHADLDSFQEKGRAEDRTEYFFNPLYPEAQQGTGICYELATMSY